MPDRPELRLANIESILASFQDKFNRREKALAMLSVLENNLVNPELPEVKEARAYIRTEFEEYEHAAQEILSVAQKVQDLSIIVYAASQVGLAAAVVDPKTGLHLLDTKGYTALTGYSSDELETAHWMNIVCVTNDSRKLDSGDSRFSFSEMAVKRKSGELVPVEIGIGSGTYNGKVANVIYMKDISERKRMEEEAGQLRRQREISKAVSEAMITTVSGISHDMANPLQALSVLRSIPLEHIDKELYAGLQVNIGLLCELNRALSNFAKGRTTEEIALVDAKELVLETLPLVKHRYDSAGVVLNYNLDSGCTINVQKTGFKSAVKNLLDNALEAIVEAEKNKVAGWCGEKSVDVYLKKESGCVALTVKDTGIGMTENQLSKLFRSIFSTKVKGRISGFGMFTVYNFVVTNKGDVAALSAGVGEGSTFYLKFPYVEK
ncbi:PAS domain-containing sensor histidine kinase [Candidatus Woesearchaeota archaeon]|nr:PAS domain-containing sensor histidine kinase [Candidatus Woesearchaeota archaeon]